MPKGIATMSDGPIQKIYWSIGEVAEIVKTTPSCIRFWEKEFNFQLHRTKSGNRYFTMKDVEFVKVINELLNVEGYTIKGAKRQLEKNPTIKTKEKLRSHYNYTNNTLSYY